jgi:sec-independent protein translocase protein TatA
MLNPMISLPNGAEWLVILAIVILVFGAAKLPDLARGTGQALRIFKAETKGLRDDDKSDDRPAAATPTSELPPAPAPAQDETTVEDRQRDTHNG